MIITDLKKLREKSKPVTDKEKLDSIFTKLAFELYQAGGVGLSGVQVGIPLRLAIINYRGEYYKLYNTEIINHSGTFIMEGEGCLSLPGQYGKTRRYNKVTIKNGDGKIHNFEGILSVIIQHELGHWDGELFTDYLIED